MLDSALELYASNKTTAQRNQVIELALPLVKQLAKQTRHLYHPQMDFEDVVSDGMVCLVDCVERFDQSKGISFQAYTYTRLKQNLIDQLRKQDFAPRRVRQMAKKIQTAQQELSHRLLREPSEAELCTALGIEPVELHLHYQELAKANLSSLDGLMELGVEPRVTMEVATPKAIFDQKQQQAQLAACIERLDDKSKLVLSLYYFENLAFHEVAQVLDVSPARVSQIHSKALHTLKQFMMEEPQ
ncbi:MAG: sigma-70 family RNA polymerase sigma factor [Erysipelotrichaceae bacterium]